ncbi:helix-turn-helix domain-containing protein [Photorhabdus sp. CRCIA-P01]|uniref:helix-turn-helix domain-containing protein n=1 Tax=Photorhabdus sp. CRCIA-P01 TaxID=2019570 RepID=UPI000E5994B0|nr:helix-turn-helix transcriptional regulator [Photorhabdus sp. CRCIA-P01]
MASIQFITDEHGKKQAVILPMDEYERLLAAADHDENYQIIPYTAGPNDDETIPHEVVSIMVDDEVSLQAAWRIYRGLSQAEVAEKLGIKQAAVSQFEKSDRPRKATIEKLAALYDCRISQLVLD